MAYEQREGSGALFKNDRKSAANSPDYTGNALVGGKNMRVAAWIKEGKKGKFLSLSITPDDGREERKAEAKKPEKFEDDIPF